MRKMSEMPQLSFLGHAAKCIPCLGENKRAMHASKGLFFTLEAQSLFHSLPWASPHSVFLGPCPYPCSSGPPFLCKLESRPSTVDCRERVWALGKHLTGKVKSHNFKLSLWPAYDWIIKYIKLGLSIRSAHHRMWTLSWLLATIFQEARRLCHGTLGLNKDVERVEVKQDWTPVAGLPWLVARTVLALEARGGLLWAPSPHCLLSAMPPGPLRTTSGARGGDALAVFGASLAFSRAQLLGFLSSLLLLWFCLVTELRDLEREV